MGKKSKPKRHQEKKMAGPELDEEKGGKNRIPVDPYDSKHTAIWLVTAFEPMLI